MAPPDEAPDFSREDDDLKSPAARQYYSIIERAWESAAKRVQAEYPTVSGPTISDALSFYIGALDSSHPNFDLVAELRRNMAHLLNSVGDYLVCFGHLDDSETTYFATEPTDGLPKFSLN